MLKSRFALATLAAMTVSGLALGACAQDANQPPPPPMPMDGPMGGPGGPGGPRGPHHGGPFDPDDRCGPMRERAKPLTEIQAKAIVEGMIAWRGDDLVVAKTATIEGGKIVVEVTKPGGEPARQITFDAKTGRMLPPPPPPGGPAPKK